MREASRRIGMSLSNLQHHVKRGNVTLIDGKVDLEVAMVQLARYIDPDQSARARQGKPRNEDMQAAAAAAANADNGQESPPAAISEGPSWWSGPMPPEGSPVGAPSVHGSMPTREQPVPPSIANVPTQETPYWEAKTRREIAEAAKAELQLQEMSRDLVKRELVERAAYESGRLLRDMVLSVPGKVAAEVAALSSPQDVEARLREALRHVLQELERLTRDARAETPQ